MRVLTGEPVESNSYRYDISESCPWCEAEVGALAVINNAPQIYTEVTWLAEPRGIRFELFFLGKRLAQHSHTCEVPWLP
jgi:hypothetical protein